MAYTHKPMGIMCWHWEWTLEVLALGVDIGGVDDRGLSVVREIAMCTRTQAYGGDVLALEE